MYPFLLTKCLHSSDFHIYLNCSLFQWKLHGREQCGVCVRCAMPVKPPCLTSTGSARNVDLWSVWIVTKRRNGKVLEVSMHEALYSVLCLSCLPPEMLSQQSCSSWWIAISVLEKLPFSYYSQYFITSLSVYAQLILRWSSPVSC